MMPCSVVALGLLWSKLLLKMIKIRLVCNESVRFDGVDSPMSQCVSVLTRFKLHNSGDLSTCTCRNIVQKLCTARVALFIIVDVMCSKLARCRHVLRGLAEVKEKETLCQALADVGTARLLADTLALIVA
jgi:hypothetical protein